MYDWGFNISFYDGNPERNGSLISTYPIFWIDRTATVEASIDWKATYGTHEIFVIIDKENNTRESNKDNNIAAKTIKILPKFFYEK